MILRASSAQVDQSAQTGRCYRKLFPPMTIANTIRDAPGLPFATRREEAVVKVPAARRCSMVFARYRTRTSAPPARASGCPGLRTESW